MINVTTNTHLGQKSLTERVGELRLGACSMSLVESLLELVERQAARLVMPAKIVRHALTLVIGDEKIRHLSHGRIVATSDAPSHSAPC